MCVIFFFILCIEMSSFICFCIVNIYIYAYTFVMCAIQITYLYKQQNHINVR